jgi:hypothetical protein
MVNVKPGRPRAITTSIPGGIRVAVRTPKNVFALMFLPVWLTGWAFGEAVGIGALLGVNPAQPSRPTPTGFLAVWLVVWTAGGALVIASFLWMAFGRETLEISGGALRVRREALRIGRTWSYDLAHVRNVRWSPAPFKPFSWNASFRQWGFGNGVVGFDYGASTVRVLPGLEEAEATGIIGALQTYVGGGAAIRAP